MSAYVRGDTAARIAPPASTSAGDTVDMVLCIGWKITGRDHALLARPHAVVWRDMGQPEVRYLVLAAARGFTPAMANTMPTPEPAQAA